MYIYIKQNLFFKGKSYKISHCRLLSICSFPHLFVLPECVGVCLRVHESEANCRDLKITK